MDKLAKRAIGNRKPRAVDLKAAAAALDAFLRAVGAPVDSDPELKQTAKRAAQAYAHDLLSGYDADPAQILSDGTASRTQGMVVVRDLSVATMCPHHLLPATGVAHVGYLPGKRVVGLGAVGKLVDAYARRFALQEDLAQNVVDALITHLGARGAACAIELAPTCMTIRGERRTHARATSYAFAGALKKNKAEREAFLRAIPTSR